MSTPCLSLTPTCGQLHSINLCSLTRCCRGCREGASKALDRIAQFYIDMAEGIFPVIEVDAGRQVDIIVTKGTNLQIRSTGGAKK